MKIANPLIYGMTAAILVSGIAFAVDSGSSQLSSKNKSAVIAIVKFLQRADDFISIEGEASGLDPSQTYISNFYDENSISKGSNTCLPTLYQSSIGIGFWVVDSEGNGTLTADVVGKELRDQRIISIQLASTQELKACGWIHINP